MNQLNRSYFIRATRLLCCLSPLLMAACSDDFKQTLGLGKEAPDEFVVVSRPPLTVPPDFELRPPVSGGDTSNNVSTENQAKQSLFGNDGAPDASLTTLRAPNVDTAVTPVTVGNTPTGATASFLSKAGADQASPDIRQTLGGEAPASDKQAGSLYEQMTSKKKTDTVVDPSKEAARIHQNVEQGKPVTEGDTPVAAPQSQSVLDRIF